MTCYENIRDRIDGARELAADVKFGRVRADGEHAAPLIGRLAERLYDMAAIADDQFLAVPAPESEQAGLRDELLAEVPVSERHGEDDFAAAIATGLAALPGDACQAVTGWLRAARQEGRQP